MGNSIIKAWLGLIGRPVAKFLRHHYGLVKYLLGLLEAQQKAFITYHYRPMEADAINPCRDRVKNLPALAIVIQGPVLQENNFTVETVKLYKKNFAQAKIILSTWENEPPAVADRFRELDITVLLNKKPDYAGQSNINLQIVSSGAGVMKAQELGAEYVMKTRTDQRIYAADVADYLHNMIDLFPARGGNSLQKKRIVGISLNTFKYRLYGLSDMFCYGHVEDMARYWTPPLDRRVFSDSEKRNHGSSLRKFAAWRICEVYFVTEFLRHIGREIQWTLRDSWQVFADHLCVVDKEQLDFFWPKYNRFEYPRQTYVDAKVREQEMTFRDWINIYSNLQNRVIPEEVLDQ